jgi:hypothetical protein
MTALVSASALCAELDRRHVAYQLVIARQDALMVSVAIPGERWEIEYFDDGHIELERFVSHGVEEAQDPYAGLLPHLDGAAGPD